MTGVEADRLALEHKPPCPRADPEVFMHPISLAALRCTCKAPVTCGDWNGTIRVTAERGYLRVTVYIGSTIVSEVTGPRTLDTHATAAAVAGEGLRAALFELLNGRSA